MPRKVTIPLYDGDDFETMADLRREVEIAKRKYDAAVTEAEEAAGAPRRMGDDVGSETVQQAKADLAAKRARLSSFIDEAAERAETWELRPIGHEEFRALCEAHFAEVEVLGLYHARKLALHAFALRHLRWDDVHARLHLTRPFYDWFTPAISERDLRSAAVP